ncbi:MAG TPA: hypothetical protein VGN41_21585 [Streptosporangiaceae bacterium]
MRKRAAPRAPRMAGARRALRGRLPDRNPLRRRADRLEFAVLVTLLAVFLVGAPLIAIVVGRWAYAGADRAARSQNATWRPVTAVIKQGVPNAAFSPYGGASFAQVPAVWTAPDGAVRTGKIAAAAGTAPGTTITIWTDRSGTLTGPPLQQPQVADQAALAGTMAVVGFSGTLIVAGVLVRRALDRRRLAAWDSAWDATGPLWSNYR